MKQMFCLLKNIDSVTEHGSEYLSLKLKRKSFRPPRREMNNE